MVFSDRIFRSNNVLKIIQTKTKKKVYKTMNFLSSIKSQKLKQFYLPKKQWSAKIYLIVHLMRKKRSWFA